MEMGRPYDAEIEYLQSNAASGFKIVSNKEFPVQCTFELKYKIDNILGMYDQQSYFSRVTTPFRTPSVFMGSRANSWNYKAIDAKGSEKYLLKINSRNTNIHTLTVNYENNTTTLDGAQSAFATSFTQYTVPSKIHIFGAIDSSHLGLYGKIYYFKISKNNQVLLDLIPVRKGNIGYMFDKVSRSILKNTGTGTFILGPDKSI